MRGSKPGSNRKNRNVPHFDARTPILEPGVLRRSDCLWLARALEHPASRVRRAGQNETKLNVLLRIVILST